MGTPKFKPTKWKMKFCMTHKQPVANITWSVYYKGSRCKGWNKECNLIEIPNVPIKIKSLFLDRTTNNGWTIAVDTHTKVEYPINHSEIFYLINKFGIPKGGIIEDQWWIWRTVSGKTKTLGLLIDDSDK